MAKFVEAKELRSDHHKLVDVVPLSTPYAIFLDFCSACNYKCKYCPTGNSQLLHDIGRKPALMNLELFTKVVNGLREFPEKVKRINLYKDGESTLHPKFCEMVRYLKDANVANSIWVKTNGSTLSPSFNEKLVNCGLDMIGISVQGVTSQAFYDIAGVRVDYEKYRMNVLDLFERSRGKCQVSIKVADVGQPETEKQKFIDDFGDRCDFITIENLHGWSTSNLYDWKLGTNGSFDGTPVVDKIVCPLTLYMLAVNSNGDISICNDDFAHYHQIGDANKQSMLEIWNSDKLKHFRLMHLRGERNKNAACGPCDYVRHLPDNIDSDLEVIKERIING